MNTRKNIISTVLIIIVLILSASAYLLNVENDPSIILREGEEKQTVEGDFIYNHPESISFPAVVRSSGNRPVETEYKGVELSKLLSSLDMDSLDMENITLNAEDGYRVILASEEINETKNIYLVFERDGERLKTKRQEGNGPFQLIIRRDPFSQRWIKHVNEIIIE